MSDATAQDNSRQRPKSDTVDSLQKVTQLMLRLHVRGLPRNYELFHEALFGQDSGLTREVLNLPPHPPQLTLDQIGLKYRLASHCGLMAETAQRDADSILTSLTTQIANGVTQKRSFARALETIVGSIKEDNGRGLRDLFEELDLVSTAATDLLKAEDALSRRMQDGLDKIEAAAKRALAANAASLRDRLTQLPNRSAFSNRLAGLYGGDANPQETALVLAKVSQFEAIRSEFGEDAANRLLRRLAVIFRKTIKKNDFVARIDGDEFAFVFGDVNPDAARAVCERLLVTVADNLIFATDTGGENGRLELAIGVALCDDTVSAAQLLAHAEVALTAAQQNRRTPVVSFSPELTRGGSLHAA